MREATPPPVYALAIQTRKTININYIYFENISRSFSDKFYPSLLFGQDH